HFLVAQTHQVLCRQPDQGLCYLHAIQPPQGGSLAFRCGQVFLHPERCRRRGMARITGQNHSLPAANARRLRARLRRAPAIVDTPAPRTGISLDWQLRYVEHSLPQSWKCSRRGAMFIIWWIIVGLIAGWITGKIMKGSGYGALMDIVIGIVGAVIGGFIMRTLGFAGRGGMIYTIIVAIIGAIILTLILRLFTGNKAKT